MKQKPHQKTSVTKQVFSDFRKRLHKSNKTQNSVQYEKIKRKDGYAVKVHRERGCEDTIEFETKQAMLDYLKKIK